MREKELCDYESASDVGNLKWFPKGRLVRDLLADYVYNLVVTKGQCLLKLQFSMIWIMKLLDVHVNLEKDNTEQTLRKT